MGGWLDVLGPWHWFVASVVLIILEVFSPAAFFLWLGIAAACVGLVLMIWPELSWPMQVILFALFSLTSVVLGRSYLKRHPIATDEPTLNRRGEQYVGRVFTLLEPVVNGQGKIRVDDTTWKISGADCPAGTKVRVTGVDGVVLRVECD